MHSFLKSVYNHLSSIGEVFPRYLFRPAEKALESPSGTSGFILPERQVSREYLDCLFEHACGTYRFIPRTQAYDLLERFYKEEKAVWEDDALTAYLLMMLGQG